MQKEDISIFFSLNKKTIGEITVMAEVYPDGGKYRLSC